MDATRVAVLRADLYLRRARVLLLARAAHPGRLAERGDTPMVKTGRKHLKYLVSSFAAVVFAYNC